jgi:hypothetical protein
MNVTSDLVLEVDFNSVDALDRIVASLRFANRWERPEVGEWVRLADAEGNVCVGQVEEIRNLIVVVRPDWGLWSTAVVTEPFVSGMRPTSSVEPTSSAAQ